MLLCGSTSLRALGSIMDQTSKAIERHLLHFDAAPQSHTDTTLTYYAGLTPHRVHAHTKATRADARVGNPLLQQLPDTRFSHYLEVDLPADSIMMTYLARGTEVEGSATEDFLSLAVHVPRQGRREHLARRQLLRAGLTDTHPKLAWVLDDESTHNLHALSPLHAHALETHFLPDFIDPFETASALLFQHPSLINLSAENGGDIPALILRECVGQALRRRSRLVDEIKKLGASWSKRVPLMEDGKVVTDHEGTIFSIEVHERVRRFMPEPMGLALKYSQQISELQGHTWNLQYGETVDQRKPVRARQLGERPVLRAEQTRWTLKALSTMNGVSTGAVAFEPPREGGWTIRETWSSDDSTPMNAEVVAALTEGRVFAVVDTAAGANAWEGSFAAQPLKDNASATFEAKHANSRAGADYVSVKLTLDALRVDLYLDLKIANGASKEALRAVRLFLREANGMPRQVWSASPTTKGQYGNLRVDVNNHWLRHLGAYAEFHDAAGKVIKPENWPSQMPLDIMPEFDSHETKRYIDLIGPVQTVFGVPLGPKTTTLDIPVPEAATSVKLYWGGLGTGEYDSTVCACGITCTAVLELALPVMLLIRGAAEKNTGILDNLMKDPK